jgi:Stage II sporulation protein E (SpoIIE)
MLASGAAGNVREIEENGLMLGMFPEAVYSSVEIRVCPGDRCLLYTDGILEAKTLLEKNSASHGANNFWKRSAIFLGRVWPTPSSIASPFFPVTTPPAPRRTTLLYSPRPRLSVGLFVFKRNLIHGTPKRFKPWNQALLCRPVLVR